jgi:hypothetical protein
VATVTDQPKALPYSDQHVDWLVSAEPDDIFKWHSVRNKGDVVQSISACIEVIRAERLARQSAEQNYQVILDAQMEEIKLRQSAEREAQRFQKLAKHTSLDSCPEWGKCRTDAELAGLFEHMGYADGDSGYVDRYFSYGEMERMRALFSAERERDEAMGLRDATVARNEAMYGLMKNYQERAEAAEATIRELREALLRLGCDCGAHEHHRPHHSSCAASSALRALAPDLKAP